MKQNISVDRVKKIIRSQDFTDVRIDRLAHSSGFRYAPMEGQLNSDALRRSIGAGSNVEMILKENQGVEGPLLVEVGYGNQTIRIRMYRGYALLYVWDLHTGWGDDKLSEWQNKFSEVVQLELAADATCRESWARDHIDQ